MKKEKDIVKETLQDFENRILQRKPFESQWLLNMNFYMGNQFCDIGYGGAVRELDKQYFWQEREVFNHIAPIIDIRMAKLSKLKPKMHVVPATDDAQDVYTAKVGKKILQATSNKVNLIAKCNQATKWSEICGTSFFKVTWNSNLGQVVAIEDDGRKIKTGDIEVSVCSPFEIYPDSATHETLEDCQSLIHARAYTSEQVKQMFGVEVEGKDVNVFSLDGISSSLGGLGYSGLATRVIETIKHDSVIVLEKYVKPNADYPNGRLIIIAGDKLVYEGDMPYINGVDGKREFPFVRQICSEEVGNFWGVSMISRLIPVQRAFNAVKNRKHEYINRLTMGVLAVEDGSVDMDNLEEEGLAPGKILVYRQGANPPKFLGGESVPTDFEKEEQELLDEFSKLGGTSEIGTMEAMSQSIFGVALELLIDENESRLIFTTDSMKSAIKTVAKHILRLYKQFATFPRLLKVVGENGDFEVLYFQSSDISSDDVQFDTDNENNNTLSQRREMIFSLLDKGLLQDENGKITASMKNKILQNIGFGVGIFRHVFVIIEMVGGEIGFGVWDSSVDLSELQTKNADMENVRMAEGKDVPVKEIDQHALHITQHTAYMLKNIYSKENVNGKVEQKFLEHIKAHKAALKEE